MKTILPMTNNKWFLKNIAGFKQAKGVFYYDFDGRQVLDCVSGLWCVNIGHGNEDVIDAIAKQYKMLDYSPIFNLSHPKAIQLSEKLAEISPNGLKHTFFTNSGSEAIDSAIKIIANYLSLTGNKRKNIILSANNCYHGMGFSGEALMKVEGVSFDNCDLNGFKFMKLPDISKLNLGKYIQQKQDSNDDLIYQTEQLFQKHGTNIAAVFIEPIIGSSGVFVYPEKYLQYLEGCCRKHHALLVFDEVITAFGRLGTYFAATYFDVLPDIIVVAKGLTSGYFPMGAVLLNDFIYVALSNNAEIELNHGYTYSGHPVGCAAALAVMDVYSHTRMFQTSKALWKYFGDKLHSLHAVPGVKGIRTIGFLGAIDLEKKLNDANVARTFMRHALKNSILVRPKYNSITLSSPLIFSKNEIDIMVDGLVKTFCEVYDYG